GLRYACCRWRGNTRSGARGYRSAALPGLRATSNAPSSISLSSKAEHRKGVPRMASRTLRVTLNGTGFAATYTAACYGLIPHKNGAIIELAGVTSGRPERAEAFARARGITQAYATHQAMLAAVHPDIDNICCTNYAHGQ